MIYSFFNEISIYNALVLQANTNVINLYFSIFFQLKYGYCKLILTYNTYRCQDSEYFNQIKVLLRVKNT